MEGLFQPFRLLIAGIAAVGFYGLIGIACEARKD